MLPRAQMLLKLVVGVGCVYELYSLPKKTPTPTITLINNTAVRSPGLSPAKVGAFAFGGYAAAHLWGLDQGVLNGKKLRAFAAWMACGLVAGKALGLMEFES